MAVRGVSKNFEKRLKFHFQNDRSDQPVLTFEKHPQVNVKQERSLLGHINAQKHTKKNNEKCPHALQYSSKLSLTKL